jgi:ribosomal protein S18 acetylase RimI-like enzyme
MEIASKMSTVIRVATSEDKSSINHLLRNAPFYHLHVDWRLPVDWLGWPEFVVLEDYEHDGELAGCFAATADPLPAAWVRIAAARAGLEPFSLFKSMLEAVIPALAINGVNQLGWLMAQAWPDSWLKSLGFQKVNAITTYILDDRSVQPEWYDEVTIQPVELADVDALAQIEKEAFRPLWRHSADGLRLAFQQSTAFEVAWLGRQIAGFHYSVPGSYDRGHEHLARLTVRPSFQGKGVGRTLLASALEGYRNRSVVQVSLNTQVDNIVSHHLYERYGFKALGDEIPVWAMPIGEGDSNSESKIPIDV